MIFDKQFWMDEIKYCELESDACKERLKNLDLPESEKQSVRAFWNSLMKGRVRAEKKLKKLLK